ncbi:MAG: hypothetical protein AAB668_00385 [Patescibacteria group bacterium]
MPLPAKITAHPAFSKFGPKNTFLILLAVTILAFAYAGFRVYTVGADLFLHEGGELFQNLPRSLEDIPTTYSVMDRLMTETGYQIHFSTAGWLLLPFSIWIVWALWRRSKKTKGRFKRWAMRIGLIPLSLFGALILLMVIGLLVQAAGLKLAEAVIMRQAGSAIRQWAVDLQRPETLKALGAETDPDIIVSKIAANPSPPAIVNDDSFFTANVIIAATNAKGSQRSAMEAVAIPRYLWQNRMENTLLDKLPVSQMWLPGHVLVVRKTEVPFAKKILPLLTEKLLNKQNHVRAALLTKGKRKPNYEFLTTEAYGSLRQSQKDRTMKEFIDTIANLKSYAARGGRDGERARELLPEWEEAYQNFLSNPRDILKEVGTFNEPDTVQLLIIDKDNPPPGVTPYATLFAATLTTSIHENLHYYSHGKKPLDSALEESLTSLFEITTTKEAIILMDPVFEIDDFAGYEHLTNVMEKVAEKIGLSDLTTLYFSGDEDRFARIFEQQFPMKYADFSATLTAIQLSADAEEEQRLTDALLAELGNP